MDQNHYYEDRLLINPQPEIDSTNIISDTANIIKEPEENLLLPLQPNHSLANEITVSSDNLVDDYQINHQLLLCPDVPDNNTDNEFLIEFNDEYDILIECLIKDKIK